MKNPILNDLANAFKIIPTSFQGDQKLEAYSNAFADIKSQEKVQEAIQKTFNPNSIDIAIERRIQMKVFGGKAF